MAGKRAIMLIAALVLAAGNSAAWSASSAEPLIDRLEQATGGNVEYTRHPVTGRLRYLKIHGTATVSRGEPQPETAAEGFMTSYGGLFGIGNPSQELRITRKKVSEQGHSFIRYQQLHRGVPVMGAELVVQLGKRNEVRAVHGKAVPAPQVDTAPVIGVEEARRTALQLVRKQYGAGPNLLTVSEPELSIYNPALLGHGLNANALVWRMEVGATDLSPIRELVLVDARQGHVALHFSQIEDAKNRTVYDHNNVAGLALPGTKVAQAEGGAVSSVADVKDAYDYSGYTYDFYLATHGRDSIDNRGMTLVSTVRFCENAAACPYQNAFWNGVQMVYGQGFAASKDVVAHELTHGVTDSESHLFYYMQSGAINESLSDVWGEIVDQSYDPIPVSANRWLMGDALSGSVGPFRSMKDPTVYGDPDRMSSSHYLCAPYQDNGGVHTDSGVNNKAAFLMTDGGSFNGKTVTGIGLQKVAKIYYEAQIHLLTSASDYADLYNALQQACSNLAGSAGITTADCQQVKNALDAVEMSQPPANCAVTDVALCSTGKPVPVFFDTLESGGLNWLHAATSGFYDAWTAPYQGGAGYTTSGINSMYAAGLEEISDSNIMMTTGKVIPATAWLDFRHAYWFEAAGTPLVAFDGGVVEYSTDNGSSWIDGGSLFTRNGYNAVIYNASGNPLAGRSAFSGMTNGFVSSRVNLSTLSGKTVRFRFRATGDNGTSSPGWLIDDVQIYACSASVDTVKPAVVGWSPGKDTVSVALTAPITATFSEPMNGATLTGATFRLASDTGGVNGSVSYNDATQTAQFTLPAMAMLQPNMFYLATITTGAADVSGNSLGSPASWGFTTGSFVYPPSLSSETGVCLVRMDGLCYASIQAALNAAGISSVIKSVDTLDTAERLSIERGLPVVLKGGYDAAFATNAGAVTKVKAVTVKSGTLTLDRITVK